MSVHDNSFDDRNLWPLEVVKDQNVVAAHTLQYHKITRRADSTDYHREMRDVFSQRPIGFYESTTREALKPLTDLRRKVAEPVPRVDSESSKDKTTTTAAEMITSCLLLVINMATWQASNLIKNSLLFEANLDLRLQIGLPL
jgi:hypothetical protein